MTPNVQSSGTAAESHNAGLNGIMTNKSHKINRNWQGQRLLPAAPLFGVSVISLEIVYAR
jgi:hypothetical protein